MAKSLPKLPARLSRKWRMRGRCGKGGQANTFVVAEKKAPGRQAVLKIPMLETPADRTRFEREVSNLVAIDHPNVVKLLDYEIDGDEAWYLSPKGEPLDKYWPCWKKPKSEEQIFERALAVTRQLLAGLAVFHETGGVHRDIKPENIIMLSESGNSRPVLIDFGIAYVRDEPRITETNGRRVATNFASPAESYYRKLKEPTPSWDCLQIAWVWAWMLMPGPRPKFGRYHWKYQDLVQHEHAERVRAVLAASSHEKTAPSTVGELLTLLQNLGLDAPDTVRNSSFESVSFADSAKAYADANAQRVLTDADRTERLETAATVVAALIEPVVRSLAKLGQSAVGRIPVSCSDHEDVTLERLQQSLVGKTRTGGTKGPVVFQMSCECATAPRNFQISLRADLREDLQEPLLPFLLVLNLGPRADEVKLYAFDSTGNLWRTDRQTGVFPHRQITEQQLASDLQQWLQDPAVFR